MREIKFRVFNKKTNLMEINLREINFFTLELGINESRRLRSDNLGNGSIVSDGEEFVLMQYTGVKDKNGKEIYEGDILEFENEFFKVEYYGSGFLALPFGFSFDDEDFPWFPLDGMCYWSGINYDGDFAKVIGNIYKNPELIG